MGEIMEDDNRDNGGAELGAAPSRKNDNETGQSYNDSAFNRTSFSGAQQRAEVLEGEFAKRAKNAESLPLQREIPAPRPFPIESLGKIMAPAARKIIEVAKVADSVCGGSFLAVASLCVQGHRDVIMDGRKHPLSEFFLTIATSGDRKSTADKLALRSIHRYVENVLQPEFDREKKLWETQFEAYKARKQKLLRGCPDDLDQQLAMLSEPKSPLEPYILVDEPTIAGLEHLFFQGRPSIGLFSDEGARFFGGFSMSKEHLASTIAVLSKLWDGASITRIRKAERFHLFGRRLCSHLMLQPVIFHSIIKNEAFKEQGVLARFLVAWPPAAGDTGAYNATNLEQDLQLQDYWEHCDRILDVEGGFPLKEGKQNELIPLSIQLSGEAKRVWQEFYTSIEAELSPSGRYRSVYSLAKKIAEHAARIAGILEVFEDLRASMISADSMQRAIGISLWYLDEALRISGVAAVDGDLDLAQKVLDFLRKRQDKQFPLWIIYKDGPGAVRDKKTAERIVRILQEHGLIRPVPDKSKWWELA